MLPRSMSVGSRSLWFGTSKSFRREVSHQTNLVPRLWTGYVTPKFDRRIGKFIPDLQTLDIVGITPTDDKWYGEWRNSDRVALCLRSTISNRYTVRSGMSVNYRKIKRLSYFLTRAKYASEFNYPGLFALSVPQGLLESSKKEKLMHINHMVYAEAIFLGWLSKRLPESLETNFLPPSNHKIWNDRTWKLFAQLQQTFE